jgi:2-polyprenyl-3-methyl-5-hydroxy-6-metoxy-1,4-benzoquinol methylase
MLPLGNSLLDKADEPADLHPLALALCPRCTLLQTRWDLPPGRRLREILYFSSVSPALVSYGDSLADMLIDHLHLGPGSSVMEIGSNDGYFLARFARRGIEVQGIEPAPHSVELAKQRGIPTVEALFTEQSARDLRKQYDLVAANFMLELIPDLGDFARGLRALMKPNGTALIEVPYLRSLVDQCRFDGIAHLRLNWFALTSIKRIFEQYGFIVVDAEQLKFRDGTLRVFLAIDQARKISPRVGALLDAESAAGLTTPGYYRDFGSRMNAAKDALRAFVSTAAQQGKKIAGYGAGIKASTLLNFVGLGRDQIEFVVDANETKVGYFMPGVGIPIRSTKKLIEASPDYTILLALDLADEVIQQQADYRKRGGKFIIPVPEVRLV